MVEHTDSLPSYNYAEKLLQQLKSLFLEELEERCKEMELLVLSLSKKGKVKGDYDELYRKIHSLKGIAGTHGVPLVSTICHNFEDRLNTLDDDFGNIDEKFIGECLRYIDLIKSTSDEAMSSAPDYTALEEKLDTIRQVFLDNNLVVLIVESSPLMAHLYQDSISNLPIKTVIVNDGLLALDRLLHERFDFMITGNSLKTLNGVALITALKASESINSDIQTIMITSASNVKFTAGMEPDHLIHRTSELANELLTVVSHLVSNK